MFADMLMITFSVWCSSWHDSAGFQNDYAVTTYMCIVRKVDQSMTVLSLVCQGVGQTEFLWNSKC